MPENAVFPSHGRAAGAVLDELAARQARDPDVHAARLFGLVYPSGRADLEALIVEVNRRYLFGNALNPFKFKDLAGMEREVVGAVASLVHRPDGEGGIPPGAMTGGGTESILMSMLVQPRTRACEGRRPSADPGTGVGPSRVRQGRALLRHGARADPARRRVACRRRARRARWSPPRPRWSSRRRSRIPHGVMDPVPELAALAAEHGIGCHVDACIGAFVLPFLERARSRGAAVGLPGAGRHRDVGRRAQVRLRAEGRVGGAPS